MSELKLTRKGEKWINELIERLSDGTEKLIILEPEQCKGLHLVLAAWNTRPASPRFTEEEREAIKELKKCAGIVRRELMPNGHYCNTRNKREWARMIDKSIARVKLMLEEDK